MGTQMDHECVFCNVIQGKEVAYLVYEDKHFISILDKRPLFYGHCLVMPREHIQTFYDLPEDLIKPQFALVQRLGKAIEQAMSSEGSFIAMNNNVSQSVPHFHIHIVPRNQKDGLRGFFWPRQKYSDNEQIVELKERIITAIANR